MFAPGSLLRKGYKMNVFKITYDNGDTVITGFNGNLEDARGYYLGNIFNLGTYRDEMHRCTAVEQIWPVKTVLELLDAMDEFRRTHQRKAQSSDWCMRALIAITESAGNIVSPAALVEMLEFSQKHQDPLRDPADWCMRVLEAIVALDAGFQGRNSWTDALKANPDSLYAQALQTPSAYSF